MMLLYEDMRAPNPRRVRIFLAEKGIGVERRHVDIMTGGHKAPDMLARNPMARIPFLELDDGRVIAESIAICRYFEALNPEPALFGRDPVEIGMVEMWQRRVEHNLLLAVSFAFRHGNPRMAQLESPQVPAWAEANLPRIAAALAFLDSELAHRAFIAGDAYSVADITALCAIDFMRVLKLALGDEHAHLRRWHAQVSARPSAGA
jgi:glutathione S-transferase